MSGSYFPMFIVVFVGGVVFVAGCAEERRSGALGDKKIVISMPPVETTHADQYICFAKSLEEIGDSFVLSSFTQADSTLVHHVATGVCEQPASTKTTWDCTDHQGRVCAGDAVNFGGWEEFTKNNGIFEFPKDVSLRVGTKTRLKYFIMEIHFRNPIKDPRVSAANVTLDFSHQPTKYNYQTYSFLVNGLIPGNSGNGYFSEAACAWKRPPAFAFRYFVHTHLYGVLVEGYLIRNDSWTLIGSQLSMGKKKDFYDLPGKPVEIKPGDIVAARCLYINADEKPVKFGMSEGEEMCNFQLDLGYDPQYDEQFRRPPVCRAISPDFRFCDNPETNQLC